MKLLFVVSRGRENMNAVQGSVRASDEYILVSAPNQMGIQFIRQMRERGIPYYAVVNNHYGKKRLEAMGVSKIISVNTSDERTWLAPEFRVRKVLLFEDSFTLTCRYIMMCSAWKAERIYVVTKRDFTKKTYRALGANRVIFINNNDVSFLESYITHVVKSEQS